MAGTHAGVRRDRIDAQRVAATLLDEAPGGRDRRRQRGVGHGRFGVQAGGDGAEPVFGLPAQRAHHVRGGAQLVESEAGEIEPGDAGRIRTRTVGGEFDQTPADVVDRVLVMTSDDLVDPARDGAPPAGAAESAWQRQPLAPGDVLFFDGLTPHRSAPNNSARDRRVYIITYNAASDGDRYQAYYDWYFSWQRNNAAGGQRLDYCGDPPQRSRPGVGSFAQLNRAAD